MHYKSDDCSEGFMMIPKGDDRPFRDFKRHLIGILLEEREINQQFPKMSGIQGNCTICLETFQLSQKSENCAKESMK